MKVSSKPIPENVKPPIVLTIELTTAERKDIEETLKNWSYVTPELHNSFALGKLLSCIYEQLTK